MKKKETLPTLSDLSIDVLSEGVPIVTPVYKLFLAGQQVYISKRIDQFLASADIEEAILEKIINDEDYTNILFLSLDTVARTTSKLAIISLALIYKTYYEDKDFIKKSLKAFKEIDDITLGAFEKIYERHNGSEDLFELIETRGGEKFFIQEYDEFLDLIHRGFFRQVSSAQAIVTQFSPISAMKNSSTDIFYQILQQAKEINL